MSHFNNVLEKVKLSLGNRETYGDVLQSFCRKIPGLMAKNFIGVFPQDVKLPPSNINCCYILNKSTSNGPGEHWVAIWQENGNIYCFDSFGRSINRILPIFNRNAGGGIIYNDDIIQKDSEEDCGQRCISFLITASTLGINNAIKI